MLAPRFDVTGVGNAIVDVLAHVDDAALVAHGLVKGGRALVDDAEAERLYAAMGPAIERSGGSVANTMAGIAALGGRAAYIGRVAEDALGDVFARDMRGAGVAFHTPRLADGPPTGRSLIFVTPDAQRTMQTCLGAASCITSADVNAECVRSSAVLLLEGYLWDQPGAREAVNMAAIQAQQAGVEVSLTLSDAGCVARNRDALAHFAEHHVQLLFGNEREILALYELDAVDVALQRLRGRPHIAALTVGANGSVVVNGDDVHVVEAVRGVHVVDTTGAGDAYAAGFLYAYTQRRDLVACARLGAALAAEVISHDGPRPEHDVRPLAAFQPSRQTLRPRRARPPRPLDGLPH